MERGIAKFKDLIIGDRIFQIPVYQRNYSWDKEELVDLWDDLLYLAPNKKHYFGTILMKKADDKKYGLKTFEIYDIIDGQQRIATVLILLREIISHLKSFSDENAEELLKLEQEYLRYKDIYKLELLGEDNSFFRDYVIDDSVYPDATLTPSQRRLKEAKSFFREKLAEIKKSEPSTFVDVLSGLIGKISGLEIIRYPVENDADAARIFETVNDRGKQLTNLEKTKSFLMQMVYLTVPEEPEEFEDPTSYLSKIHQSFSKIFRDFEEIRNTERGKNLKEDDIQRYHFVIYESDAKGDVKTSFKYLDFLKKKIRDIYREDKKKCLDYILKYTKGLEEAFFALKEIITYKKDDKIGTMLDKIYILGSIANFYPLMIASWIKFKHDLEKMKDILKLIEIFSFRVYSIGRKRSDTGIASFYPLGYRVHSEKLVHVEITKELIEMINYYQDDKAFEINLMVENFYWRVYTDDIKYLLVEFEESLRKHIKEPLDLNLENIFSEKFEIEHVWARDPSKLKLSKKLEEIHEQYKDKLGNLTLASQQWNSKWRHSPFEKKRKDYQNSVLRVQKELAVVSKWGKEQIKAREKRIVNFALERWKVP